MRIFGLNWVRFGFGRFRRVSVTNAVEVAVALAVGAFYLLPGADGLTPAGVFDLRPTVTTSALTSVAQSEPDGMTLAVGKSDLKTRPSGGVIPVSLMAVGIDEIETGAIDAR